MNISRVVHVYLRPETYTSGGVNKSAQSWASHFAERVEVRFLHAKSGYRTELERGRQLSHGLLGHHGRGRATMMPKGLSKILEPTDLLYLHEGWTLSNLLSGWVARRTGVPYIVMPHGVYEQQIIETLKLPRWREAAERRLLEQALAIHVFFESEKDEVARIAPRARFIVSPTGFDSDGHDAPILGSGDGGYVAWLGRFDILHKGIDLLVEAMGSLPGEMRPVIRMAGPDYHGDKSRVVDLVASSGLSDWIQVEDALTSDQVNAFLLRATAFVHVPRWESLGRTVVESLLCGTPVLLSSNAHIARGTTLADGVLTTELDVPSVAAALTALRSTPWPPRQEIRRRASVRFAWEKSLSSWDEQLRRHGVTIGAVH